jgi:hypothetical protein
MFKKILVAGLALGLASCASHYVIDPPAVDLMTAEPIGLVTFSVVNATGGLDQFATQAFLEQVSGAQRVPVLELGKLDAVLAKTGQKALNPEAARAIGEAYKVKSFFYGDVRISKVKSQVNLAGVLSGDLSVRASFDIAVTGRLVSAETGATIWTSSAARNGTLGLLSLGENSVPYFGMTDKDQATMNLVRGMMREMTWDFRPTRRKV